MSKKINSEEFKYVCADNLKDYHKKYGMYELRRTYAFMVSMFVSDGALDIDRARTWAKDRQEKWLAQYVGETDWIMRESQPLIDLINMHTEDDDLIQ